MLSPALSCGDRAYALSLLAVSRETEQRFAVFVDLLKKWQRTTKLVSPATLKAIWLRHVVDSAQLPALAPAAQIWIDFGSGAGFPGLVIAILLASSPRACVHCIESDRRKCSFLREVARATGAPACIHCARVERLDELDLGPVEALTARAFASLPVTISLAKNYLDRAAVGILPVGQSSPTRWAACLAQHGFDVNAVQSIVDPKSKILVVRKSRQEQPGVGVWRG